MKFYGKQKVQTYLTPLFHQHHRNHYRHHYLNKMKQENASEQFLQLYENLMLLFKKNTIGIISTKKSVAYIQVDYHLDSFFHPYYYEQLYRLLDYHYYY